MNLTDMTVIELVTAAGWLALVLIIIAVILWTISYIINWTWWKKEYRKDFQDWRYFVEHRQEILDCIHKRRQ